MRTHASLAPAALILALVCSQPLHAHAQDAVQAAPLPPPQEKASAPTPEHDYRLQLRVIQFSADNKITDSRSYSMLIGLRLGRPSSIRSDDKFWIRDGAEFLDINANFDVQDSLEEDKALRFFLTAHIATISATTPGTPERPLRRDINWSSGVTVPIGKPTIVFSSDNNADHGRTELEVTATLLK
jgi:hypothetical protein